jgi:hypothetical protein
MSAIALVWTFRGFRDHLHENPVLVDETAVLLLARTHEARAFQPEQKLVPDCEGRWVADARLARTRHVDLKLVTHAGRQKHSQSSGARPRPEHKDLAANISIERDRALGQAEYFGDRAPEFRRERVGVYGRINSGSVQGRFLL